MVLLTIFIPLASMSGSLELKLERNKMMAIGSCLF